MASTFKSLCRRLLRSGKVWYVGPATGALLALSGVVHKDDNNHNTVRPKVLAKPNPKPTPGFLHRNFIADVVDGALPPVVSITCLAASAHVEGSYAISEISQGSGFCIREDGLIVTNYHVVKPDRHDIFGMKVPTEIVIRLTDGRRYPATIHSFDSESDIALLQVTDTKGFKFPVSQLGTSSSLRPGEFVIALGSPLSLESTVTAGIVSAVGRYIPGRSVDYIQIDNPTFPGNSGGPLVNLEGKVVGINTMKVFDRLSSGIGMAIPIDIAREVVTQLIETRIVKRPWIGMKFVSLTDEVIENEGRVRRSEFPVNITHGALIVHVTPNSPAAKAGLVPGDVIVEVDGTKIYKDQEVIRAVGWTIGKHHNLRVIRRRPSSEQNETIDLTLTAAFKQNERHFPSKQPDALSF